MSNLPNARGAWPTHSELFTEAFCAQCDQPLGWMYERGAAVPLIFCNRCYEQILADAADLEKTL